MVRDWLLGEPYPNKTVPNGFRVCKQTLTLKKRANRHDLQAGVLYIFINYLLYRSSENLSIPVLGLKKDKIRKNTLR